MRVLEEKYLAYIDDRIAEHNKIGEQYKADDRKDEADLEKIKANIYEIFRTLFLNDIKQLEGKDLGNNKDIGIYNEYLHRFDTIPTNWKVALDKAKEHGDITKQVIENKLVCYGAKERFIAMFDGFGR